MKRDSLFSARMQSREAGRMARGCLSAEVIKAGPVANLPLTDATAGAPRGLCPDPRDIINSTGPGQASAFLCAGSASVQWARWIKRQTTRMTGT